MSVTKSVFENLTSNLAPVIRKLSDVSLKLLGNPVQILRITQTTEDLLGDSTYSYTSQIVENVLINIPFNEVEIFASKDDTDQSAESLSIFDLLPISMMVPFEGSRADVPVEFDSNDFIVLVVFDNKGNKIPIIMQGPKLVSSFFGRYEVGRKYEMTLVRGVIETNIQTQIDNYVASLGIPEVDSTVPINGATGVVVSADMIINFNNKMDQTLTEGAISFTPNIAISGYTWDTASDTVTLSISGSLISGTLYSGTIAITAETEANMNLESAYSWGFTTQ